MQGCMTFAVGRYVKGLCKGLVGGLQGLVLKHLSLEQPSATFSVYLLHQNATSMRLGNMLALSTSLHPKPSRVPAAKGTNCLLNE